MNIMSNKDEFNYARICVGKIYSYSVCEDGTVIKTSRKHYRESTVKPYLKRGKATVKINGKEYVLKRLVAKYFMGLKDEDNVIIKDNKPFNCHKNNLKIISKSDLGRQTGYKSGRAKPVVVDGIEYQSVRKCAKELHCSYQTLSDYLNGKVKKSVVTENDINVIRYGV